MDYISDKLYIGDISDAESLSRDIEVITLSSGETSNTTEHLPLTDGKNPQEEFDEVVDTVIEKVNEDKRTLVHCAMGVSRSPTIVATALAEIHSIDLEAALSYVKEKRGYVQPEPQLLEQARLYLGSPPKSPPFTGRDN